MSCLFTFPQAAALGKNLAKSKIYEHGTPSSKVKGLFVKEVEKIIWSYKLSPATINRPASDGVQEIQIFTIALKTGELSQQVLQAIDKVIPSPIFFELTYGGKIRYAASYKRPSEVDKAKWVISSYFQSDWMNNDDPAVELPVVLNMGMLYHSFLTALSPILVRQGEELGDLVSRVDFLRGKEREAEKLEGRIRKERQFNRRVALNRTLNELTAGIERLKK